MPKVQLCAFLQRGCISEEIFQNAASNMSTYEPCFPATAKKSNVMKAKDFLGMFQALDSLWDSQNFLKMIMEIRSYILSSISIARMKRIRSIRLSVPGLDEAIRTSLTRILGLFIIWKFNFRGLYWSEADDRACKGIRNCGDVKLLSGRRGF